MSERHGGRPPDRAASAERRNPDQRRRMWSQWGLLAGVGAVVLAGGGLWLAGLRGTADLLWIVATCAGLVPGVAWVVRSLLRRQVGVDVIAVLALAGALVVREYLAGAVVAVMLATGRSLEAYAERRAARDLHALLERAPRTARRRTPQGAVEVVGLDDVRPDDRLLVGPGEVVAVDGCVEDPATLDEATVTGESRPVDRRPGERVASGVVNAGPAFGMRATTTAAQSTYAGIVRLAKEATEKRAPMVRLADWYAAWFVPFTLLLSSVSWGLSGSLVRAVAVLVRGRLRRPRRGPPHLPGRPGRGVTVVGAPALAPGGGAAAHAGHRLSGDVALTLAAHRRKDTARGAPLQAEQEAPDC